MYRIVYFYTVRVNDTYHMKIDRVMHKYIFLAPAVPVGETEGAMDSASVFFASSFAYNFVRK